MAIALRPKLRGEAGLTNTRIIAYSGYKDDPDLRLAAGIDAHLLKPVSLERLKDFFDCEGWSSGKFPPNTPGPVPSTRHWHATPCMAR